MFVNDYVISINCEHKPCVRHYILDTAKGPIITIIIIEDVRQYYIPLLLCIIQAQVKKYVVKIAFLFPGENHRSMSRLLTSSIFYRLTEFELTVFQTFQVHAKDTAPCDQCLYEGKFKYLLQCFFTIYHLKFLVFDTTSMTIMKYSLNSKCKFKSINWFEVLCQQVALQFQFLLQTQTFSNLVPKLAAR